MKQIVVIFLFSLCLVLGSSSGDAQDPLIGPNFESRSHIYQAYFPVPHTEEVSRTARYLNKELQYHSYISAEYKSKELGHYVKYSIIMEPLEKYKPYQDAVEEKVEDLINFYDSSYEYQIPNLSDYSEDGNWGKDITIEFFDGSMPAAQRPKSHKPWVIRRRIFHNSRHIFILEALGSTEYLYARASNEFFDKFRILPHAFR